jgi:hypothetical protein
MFVDLDFAEKVIKSKKKKFAAFMIQNERFTRPLFPLLRFYSPSYFMCIACAPYAERCVLGGALFFGVCFSSDEMWCAAASA